MFFIVLAVLAVLFIVETVLTEVEHWGWATFTLLATFVGSLVCHHYFGTPSIIDFVREHGVFTMVYLLVYLGVGVGWSFVKWFSHLHQFRDAYRELKLDFLKFRGLDVTLAAVPEDHLPAFKDWLGNKRYSMNANFREEILNLTRPRASKNKARITAWMAFWPCSLIGTLLNDPVRRAFNFLFNNFKALYQKMSDWVFRKDAELK